MYLKLDESKWHKHTYEWSDRSKGLGRVDVYKGQIEVAEDVAPVIHAHWIKTFYAENGYFMGICSHCSMPNIVSLYCGECGAKMNKE